LTYVDKVDTPSFIYSDRASFARGLWKFLCAPRLWEQNQVRWDYVFWFLWGVIAIWQTIAALIDPTITLGEVLGIGATALLAMAAAGRVVWNSWHRALPFKMRYCDQPTNIPNFKDRHRVFRKIYKGRPERFQINLEIQTKQPVNLREFDLRFVTKKFWRFGPTSGVSTDVIKLGQIATPELQNNQGMAAKNIPDEEGGIKVHFDGKSKEWVIGEPLWIEVMVNAKKKWSGYISFRCRGDRIGFARRRFKIRE